MIETIIKYPIQTTEILLTIIAILLVCLFSPNIIMFIHKKHFKWKN